MSDAEHTINPPHRRIRSFVRRQGRLTAGQQRALDELWPLFGLELAAGMQDFSNVFGRRAPLTLEIGFGNGSSLAAMADADPGSDFIGIEVHRPGIGHLLQKIEAQHLGNLRVYCEDAVEVLESCIADASLDRVLLFFPDPWHKKRHHKRRILQPEFIDLVARKLKTGGHFHMATDWEHYAEQMLRTMDAAAGFSNVSGTGNFAARPDYRPATKFEMRGQSLGHGVRDLVYRRRKTA
ncbi:MAG: tRNA (guanosine(46)-N7)-methyltransferase TrmB [Thiogranum sp.]|nr:tRNA (guanosine(46)-N7)-methyltransferase TrmB [Thiogranum sp.]